MRIAVAPVQAISRPVEENSPVGTAVGATLRDTAPFNSSMDTFDILGGNDDDIFRMSTTSAGVIEVNLALLDFESQSSYSLTVEGKEAGVDGSNVTAGVTITVEDVK